MRNITYLIYMLQVQLVVASDNISYFQVDSPIRESSVHLEKGGYVKIEESNRISTTFMQIFNRQGLGLYRHKRKIGIAFATDENIRTKRNVIYDTSAWETGFYPGDFARCIQHTQSLLVEHGAIIGALDARGVRFFEHDLDLKSAYPNLRYLALAREGLPSNYAKILLPENLKVLVLEGFDTSDSLAKILSQCGGLRALILKNCWTPSLEVSYAENQTHVQIDGVFKEVQNSVELVVMIECSGITGIEVLNHFWPKAHSFYLDISFDRIGGWLSPLSNPNYDRKRIALSMPDLKNFFFTIEDYNETEPRVRKIIDDALLKTNAQTVTSRSAERTITQLISSYLEN